MAVFKCKMCGGTLEINPNETVATCEYCGSQQTLPRLDDDRRVNLYDRANHFRRNNEFDKAAGIYEQILNDDNTDAEAYWSLVLCRYGIEYVEDPATHKRVPTVNRAQYTSIFDDDNYKSAINYADTYQRAMYEEEARAINEIQKGILEISQKEEPFDVFICYKETDNSGRRTRDSVLANDLYHQLTQEGFKVFFSRITLEDKLGTAYEPYIFAALNSAKVMVVLGTKPEYFNAVWVKNEWSRYLALVNQSGGKKVLIPAYRDMDPYDLPEEFSHLQAQDMGKLGFMQDLIRGIKKIAKNDEPKAEPAVKQTVAVSSGSANTAALLKRVNIFLEDGDWDSADEYCEKVLDIDPENSEAYVGKLMAELHTRRREDLKNQEQSFDGNNNFEKAVRFGDDKTKSELNGYIAYINTRNKNVIYGRAVSAMNAAKTEDSCKEAADIFKSIPGWKDADKLAKECIEKAETARKDAIYDSAKKQMTGLAVTGYKSAINTFKTISGWKDTDKQIEECQRKINEIEAEEEADRVERANKEEELRKSAQKAAKKRNKIIAIVMPIIVVCIAFVIVLNVVIIPNNKYNEAMKLFNSGKYSEAASAFEEINGYKDSDEKAKESKYNDAMNLYNSGKNFEALMLFQQIPSYPHASTKINELWDKIASREHISAGSYHTVGLKSDGTVVATMYLGDQEYNYGQCDVSDWKGIVAVSADSFYTVGLKLDGTVVAVGYNGFGQCEVSEWRDIVAISAGNRHTVGLKSDGTVVSTKNKIFNYGQCNVSDWKDIIAVSAGGTHTVGLKSDGTVVAIGNNDKGQCDVDGWKDIIAVSAGECRTVGLKSDGTVVSVGEYSFVQDRSSKGDVSKWKDIIAVSAGDDNIVGVKSDGTVVVIGNNDKGQCDVDGWKDIIAVSAGQYHTVGLKSDGTVVATMYLGDQEYYHGQCDVSRWNYIKTDN